MLSQLQVRLEEYERQFLLDPEKGGIVANVRKAPPHIVNWMLGAYSLLGIKPLWLAALEGDDSGNERAQLLYRQMRRAYGDFESFTTSFKGQWADILQLPTADEEAMKRIMPKGWEIVETDQDWS